MTLVTLVTIRLAMSTAACACLLAFAGLTHARQSGARAHSRCARHAAAGHRRHRRQCTGRRARAADKSVAFGFNTYVAPRAIAEQRELGATVSRLIIAWSAVQSAPGQWDWQQYDEQYAELVSGGLKPLIVVYAAPCWARPSMVCDDAQYTGPPDSSYDSAWSSFVRAVAARYPAAIGIEVWNEPNMNMFFWPKADPARFARLLREAYTAVKRVRPAMPVVSGGLAGSPATGIVPLGEGDKPFLSAMFAAGARGSINAIGIHPYPILWGSDGSQLWDRPQMEQTLQRVRNARNAAGASSLPLWITEVGESTSTQPGFPPAVTAAEQASDLAAMVASVRADADVPVMLIHTLEDQPAGYNDPNNGVAAGFGVFSSDGTPKPAACALSLAWHGSLTC